MVYTTSYHQPIMKSTVTITLDNDLLSRLRDKASTDRRSLSQTLGLLIEAELGSVTPTRRKASKKEVASV
jgi:hypothetical protein